jgi:hypothetical protein
MFHRAACVPGGSGARNIVASGRVAGAMRDPAEIPPYIRGDAAAHADLTVVVEDGIRRYFADRRARVAPFVDAHFSFRGSAAIHRAAVGWDIARAPLNLSLALPHVGLKAAAAVSRKLGATRLATALAGRGLLLRTSRRGWNG